MVNSLMEKLLPAAFICKGFIEGIPDCNYERYLLEVVNASTYFMRKSLNEAYLAPAEEAHGEYDCYSSNYAVDFKLIAGETALRARNLFSESIQDTGFGIIVYGRPKTTSDDPQYKPIQATRIHAALRSMTLKDLKSIRNSQEKRQGIVSDIRSFLKTLETKKHLLLFFPFEFSIEQEENFDDDVKEIIKAVNGDFKEAWEYRREVAVQYDTYLVFLYASHFVITALDDNGLLFADAVQEKFCPTYIRIKSYMDLI